MADDIIEGPDANEVRRHAKKMYTEAQYRQRYRRIDFYKPNAFQLRLHNAPIEARFINARAANQMGKSTAAAMQLAMDATAFYPSWYKGRKFLTVPKIIRPYDFQALIASNQSYVLRDGLARALLGDLSQEDGLGTGAIPLDAIVGKPTMSRGISDFFDTVVMNREIGGQAAISTRTYDGGRRTFQGTAQDEVFLDEDDPALSEIIGEAWARLTTTNGRLILTATAILGLTFAQKMFEEDRERHPERHLIVGDLAEADHLTDTDRASMESGYREDEREARIHGGIRQGSGAVFAFDRREITCSIDPTILEDRCAFLWGCDLAHSSGPTAHPYAAVLIAHDRDRDIVYVIDAFKLRGRAVDHVERLRASMNGGAFAVRMAWPKDGGIHDLNSGHTLIQAYKSRGVRTLPQHSTFADGSVSLEASVITVQERMSTGRLLIQRHLTDLLTELSNYHRDTDGRIVPQDDDCVSALLCAMRSLRHARRLDETAPQGGEYVGVDPATGLAFGKRISGRAYLDEDAGERFFGIDA